MGSAGSGRSNFINKLMAVEGARASRGVGSFTQDIREITVKLSDHREYVFVDTPGFKNAVRPAVEVLQMIADWLEMKYKEGALLTGVIFTHEMTNHSLRSSLLESFDIFCCICGDKAAKHVRLVTTMWDQVKNPRAAENTVSQLEKDLWKPLLDAGARHMRFENSKQSAWDVVKDFGAEREALLLQKELVDEGKHLYETFAGHALYLQSQKLSQEARHPNKQLWRVFRWWQDRTSMKELEAPCKHIKMQLQKAQEERRRKEMCRHPHWHRLSCFLFKPNTAVLDVTKNDLVIFVVDPTGAGKSWFTTQLSQNDVIQVEDGGHPCTKWHPRVSRFNIKNSTSSIFVVDTPSFHTKHAFYAQNFMRNWLKSRFTKKCQSGILFLHPFSKDPRDPDVLMQRHLDMFATSFPKKSMIPSRVYVVPTGNSTSATLGQRLSELDDVMKSLHHNGGHKWHASVFPGVFNGQTEVAWGAAVLLLKDIVTQPNELSGSRRPTLKCIPPKRANDQSAVKSLADLLFERFKDETTDCSLDAKIILGRVARDLTPMGHPGHVSAIIACADILSERYEKEESRADLDELVTLRRAAWASIPPLDPRQQRSLVALDDCLYKRFKRSGAIADLEEIISLRRLALECASLRDRCRSLVDLANALRERYQVLRLKSDLKEAIKVASAALALDPLDHLGCALSQSCLADCLETEVGEGISRVRSARAVTDGFNCNPSDMQKAIMNIISETIANMPPRLLHTPTGILCDRDAQQRLFVQSPAYSKLFSLTSLAEIRSRVSLLFGFTMLSHRWGIGEPLLRDIEGRRIYDLDGSEGLAKLQKFCLLSLRRGFFWAWSDTCCIDKDSSAELQEAIGSMFSWYHRSSLTIAYLSDVPDTASLASSVWFKRGWTLQELLAPPTLVFYMQDWSVALNSDAVNHKTDPAMLEEVQKATGIAVRHLKHFCPGMDDARSRLYWASCRRTTRPEDVAYSLFGIFKVHLPVLYGESADNALGRLLVEVISQSGDISVLDWVGEASSFHSCFPADLTPYQTTRSTRSKPGDHARCNNLHLEGARTLYSTLAKLPHPHFVHRRLKLSAIVYHVTAVKLLGIATGFPNHTYEIHASHLVPVMVTLPVCLEEDPSTYVLLRPWLPKWAENEVDATWELLEQLERPFNALLLQRLPHNQYRRIGSDRTITARVQDLASIADGEILSLEII
ncbi:hypothetical protein EDD15DRAFT_385717 [Pisolithus albus]|nr:hypothetical protein EDD15DRAFT_385717 [Pisolithus albus]